MNLEVSNMKNRIILKKEQLIEYVERKKANSVYYDIMIDLHHNMKNLNETISLKNANQSIIDNYKRKGLITPKVEEQLIKNKIIDNNYEIL